MVVLGNVSVSKSLITTGTLDSPILTFNKLVNGVFSILSGRYRRKPSGSSTSSQTRLLSVLSMFGSHMSKKPSFFVEFLTDGAGDWGRMVVIHVRLK